MPRSTTWLSSSIKSANKFTISMARRRRWRRRWRLRNRRKERLAKFRTVSHITSCISIWDRTRTTTRTSGGSCKKRSIFTRTTSWVPAWLPTCYQDTRLQSIIRSHPSKTHSKARSRNQLTRFTSDRRMRLINLPKLRVRLSSFLERVRMWPQ